MFPSLLHSASVEKWETLLLATSIFAKETLQTAAPLGPLLQMQLGFGSGGRSLGQKQRPKGDDGVLRQMIGLQFSLLARIS